MSTEIDRRGFLSLTIGAVLLPTVPMLEAVAPSAFGRVEIEYHAHDIPMTAAFEITEEQAFGLKTAGPFVLEADQKCTVTGFRLVLSRHPLDDSITNWSTGIIPSSTSDREWHLDVGDTLTLTTRPRAVVGDRVTQRMET